MPGGGRAWAGPGGPRLKIRARCGEEKRGASWAEMQDEDQVLRGGGLAGGQVGCVCGAEDRKRSRRGLSGARSEYAISGACPLPGEGRGLRLVHPGGRKEGEERRRLRRASAGADGGAPDRRVRRRDSPAGASRRGRCGVASGRVRGLPALAQRLCSVLQVYPEPRCESECLSNIREFLRGCGASLRLEVSGPGRGAGSAGLAAQGVGKRGGRSAGPLGRRGQRSWQGLEGQLSEAGRWRWGNGAEQRSPETRWRACPTV